MDPGSKVDTRDLNLTEEMIERRGVKKVLKGKKSKLPFNKTIIQSGHNLIVILKVVTTLE